MSTCIPLVRIHTSSSMIVSDQLILPLVMHSPPTTAYYGMPQMGNMALLCHQYHHLVVCSPSPRRPAFPYVATPSTVCYRRTISSGYCRHHVRMSTYFHLLVANMSPRRLTCPSIPLAPIVITRSQGRRVPESKLTNHDSGILGVWLGNFDVVRGDGGCPWNVFENE